MILSTCGACCLVQQYGRGWGGVQSDYQAGGWGAPSAYEYTVLVGRRVTPSGPT